MAITFFKRRVGPSLMAPGVVIARRTPAVWLIAAILLLAGTTSWARPQGRSGQNLETAAIAGRVVDREDKQVLLAGVRVTLFREPGGTAIRETLTETDGGYLFPALPAGSYSIRAYSPGWLATSFGQTRPGRSGTVMVLGAGEARKELTIQLFRGSVITGRVQTERGQTQVGTVVEAFQLRYSAGGGALVLVQTTNTDDTGQYRLIGLPPGDYFVRASPSVGGRLSIPGQTFAVQRGRQKGYVPLFFPAAPSPSEAAAIAVGVGEIRTGTDFTLTPVPLAQISGSLLGLPKSQTLAKFRRVFDDGLLRSGEIVESEIGPDGRFVLANVRPGPLTLLVETSAETTKESWWSLARLVVNGDSSGVAIQMQPGLTVRGEVRFLSTAAVRPSQSNLAFSLKSVGPLGLNSIQVGQIDKDDRFAIRIPRPGSYLLDQLSATQWSIVSIRQGGNERVFGPLEIQTDVSDVVVTLTDHPASLSGTLLVPTGALVTDYTFLAFPADPATRASRSGAIYAASLDTAGRFTIPSILPGDYLVAVTDDIEVNAWFDPRVIEQLSQGGIPVRVSQGEAKRQDLTIRKLP